MGAAAVACTPPDEPGPGSPLGTLHIARPRVLMRPGDPPVVQARLDREPYRTLFLRLDANAHSADAVALDDHAIASERTKAKAAKDLAFEYAVDRVVTNGVPASTASPADRAAIGSRVRVLLLSMFTQSRLDVPAPLGGTDRDINTSEELLQYATAYDTIRGGGYDFGADDPTIRAHLSTLASALYADYRDPAQHGGYALVLPNNHRSKSAAALAIAGIVLADYPPAPGTDPDGSHDPAAWLRFGIDQVDLVENWLYNAGDGAYGEGPYYQRYADQNLLPFLRAWDRLTNGASTTVDDHVVRSLYRDPTFRAMQRWMLDLTLPDGTLAPVDDSNVGASQYFGALDQTDPNAAAFAWRWRNTTTPFESDGSVDVAADEIVAYNDTAVTAAPPAGSPTRFYVEGGDAIFRSDWSANAVESVVLGEHGAADELGRDRTGNGRIASAAHEQADPGSFLLHAFGERLLLDPGYLTYETRSEVSKPQDHNIVLVDGTGPQDPFLASVLWGGNPSGPPPLADGQATLSAPFDTDFLDGVRVTTRYGPATAPADVSRRFLFADNRYLVVADTLHRTTHQTGTYTWLVHGNGGGTSGGTFTATANGGHWEHGGARVDAAITTDGGPIQFGARTANHEVANRVELTHTALSATVAGSTVHSLMLLYPTRTADSVPVTSGAGTIASPLTLVDTTGDRQVQLVHDAKGQGNLGIDRLVDTHTNGTLRLAYARDARVLSAGGVALSTSQPGDLAVRTSVGTVDVLAKTNASRVFVVTPFPVASVDGACRAVATPTGTLVTLGRDHRFTLRAATGNGTPSADAGPDQGVVPGTTLTLNGKSSCDPEHDALTPHWDLVAAPPGSAWKLTTTGDVWHPQLLVDTPGSYRVELIVTDAHGATSRPVDVNVWTTPLCAGDRLQWNDPRCTKIPS